MAEVGMRAQLGLLVAILIGAGCGPIAGSQEDAGPDGPPAPLTGLVSIQITPADATLDIVGVIPAKQAYTAEGSFDDGHREDITSQVAFAVDDPTLGGFEGTLFTSKLWPGDTTVRATNGAVEGTTTLTLWYAQVRFAPGVREDAPDLFAGAAGGGSDPELLYPPDGTLIPPNLTILDVQFRPGNGNDLFEVRFKGDTYEVRLYADCSASSGCDVVPEPEIWQEISSTNAGHVPMQVSVRGLTTSSPGKAGLSETRAVGIAQEQMNGGIYYWQATGDGIIKRYDFGLPTPQGETYYSAAQAGSGLCVGCHTMSAKGNRIAVGFDAPTQVSTLQVLDVATKAKLFQLGQSPIGGGSNFQAFSPDETEIITSNGATLVLRDATDGTPKDPNPLVPLGTMPDYAPDGSSVVFAKPVASPCMVGNMCMPGINKGSIALLPWDSASSTWGSEQILVQQSGSENNYYPAFSPDGKWILYNYSAAANSYDAADARVRIVNVETGAVTDLTLANDSGGNSWPKWSPFIQTHRGGTIMWFTFSSRRPYGYQSVACESGNCAQVWMAAIDVEKALAGVEDPSYAAFRLPFQDIATGNHIAQWVPTIVRTPCDDQSDCGPGEICTGGECVPDIQ
jgi:hypothetical protein